MAGARRTPCIVCLVVLLSCSCCAACANKPGFYIVQHTYEKAGKIIAAGTCQVTPRVSGRSLGRKPASYVHASVPVERINAMSRRC